MTSAIDALAAVQEARRTTQLRSGLGPDSAVATGFAQIQGGQAFYVDGVNGGDGASGLDPDNALATVQAALNKCVSGRGDVIYVAPADYDESVTITKDNVTLIGVGTRGGVAIAPSASDAVAILIDGTTATGRVEEVTLVNIGGEGNGTGGGLHIKGNIRRIRVRESKFEGGAFACKLESTAEGSVGDVISDDCEFAWTTTGIHITASGGGDPVTNLWLRDPIFHDCSSEWILSNVAHTTGLIVRNGVFGREEDASAPVAGQIDVAVASSEGIFANNSFALATMDATILVIAAGVIWVGNMTEAGVGGRPA